MSRTKPAKPARAKRAKQAPQRPSAFSSMSTDEFFRTPVGKAKYTVERFFGNCSEETADMLKEAFGNGDQLASTEIPHDGLPVVAILAAYARQYGVDLVDDYPELMQRTRDNMDAFEHPDKCVASRACINFLDLNDKGMSEEAFETICLPAIWEELFGGDE